MRKKGRPTPNEDQYPPLREEEQRIRAEIASLVGQRIRESRWERAELAAKLGYSSPAQLSKWTRGTAVIPPEKLALLADLLDLPVSSLFPPRVGRASWHDEMVAAIARQDYPAALALLIRLMNRDGND